jgi:Ca2+-binding EF-hand superfamily protein
MTIRLLAAAVLMLGTSPVFAAGPVRTSQIKTDPRIAAEFKARDTNHDGVLTKPEVAAGVARMRVRKGATAPAQAQAMADALFAYADANRDGKVTLSEMQGQMVAMAARYDRNHDGVVSREEQRTAQAEMLARTRSAPPQGR